LDQGLRRELIGQSIGRIGKGLHKWYAFEQPYRPRSAIGAPTSVKHPAFQPLWQTKQRPPKMSSGYAFQSDSPLMWQGSFLPYMEFAFGDTQQVTALQQ
jgi:hypothetical protein